MAQRIRYLCIGILAAIFLVLPLGINHARGDEGHSGGDTTSGSVLGFEGQHHPVWRLQGGNPFLIGGYGDNFSHDGSSVTPLIGKAKVVLDAEKNTGTARFTVFGTVNPEKGKTYTGEITLHYRVGSGGPAFQEGGVADFVYLHGDTGQDAPVMPKIRTFLGSWGSADVFINGVSVGKTPIKEPLWVMPGLNKIVVAKKGFARREVAFTGRQTGAVVARQIKLLTPTDQVKQNRVWKQLQESLRRKARSHWRRYLQIDPTGGWAHLARRRLEE